MRRASGVVPGADGERVVTRLIVWGIDERVADRHRFVGAILDKVGRQKECFLNGFGKGEVELASVAAAMKARRFIGSIGSLPQRHGGHREETKGKAVAALRSATRTP